MNKKNFYHHKTAFSLIELVIVLTIAAFLIASIIAGVSMLGQTKLRNIITEAQSYMDATALFQSKYGELPGDSVRAFSIWGTNCAPTAAECNGNGDGHITYDNSGTTEIEALRAWQHLSLAGMVKGRYTGIATTTGQSQLTINIPSSNYSGAGWGFDFSGAYAPPTDEGQYLVIGQEMANNAAIANFLTPADAESLDGKIDDGKPRDGMVFASGTVSGSGCYSSNTITTTYNLGVANKVCILKFTFQKY